MSFNSCLENSFSKPDNFYYAALIAEFDNDETLSIEQMENPIYSLSSNYEQYLILSKIIICLKYQNQKKKKIIIDFQNK